VPHVPPGRAGGRSDMQHWVERNLFVKATPQGWKVTPSPNGGEAPVLKPPQGGFGPALRLGVVLPGCVPGIARIELLRRTALLDASPPAERPSPRGGPGASRQAERWRAIPR